MSSINIDEKLVKKVGDKNDIPMTQEQSDEWDRCAEDKYYFFENYVYVQAPKGKVLFSPREYQRRIIDSCTNHRFVSGLSGRQSGKCLSGETLIKLLASFPVLGVQYELTATIADIHTLSKCKSPQEAVDFLHSRGLINEQQHPIQHPTQHGDS